MTPEGRVKAKLKRWLATAEHWSFWPVQTGYGAATVDCFTMDGYGRLVAIECKREGVNKPTPRQALEMQRIRQGGGVTFVVTMQDGELVWREQKGR